VLNENLAANLTRAVGVFKLGNSNGLMMVAASGPMALGGEVMRERRLLAG
jgi:hypothetical protein